MKSTQKRIIHAGSISGYLNTLDCQLTQEDRRRVATNGNKGTMPVGSVKFKRLVEAKYFEKI